MAIEKMECEEFRRLIKLPDAEFNKIKTDELIARMAQHAMDCDSCEISGSDEVSETAEAPQGALGDGSI